MNVEQKVRENRLRRMAKRQGLTVVKSRRRDPRALDFGHMYLVNERNGVEAGPYGNLDELEAALLGQDVGRSS